MQLSRFVIDFLPRSKTETSFWLCGPQLWPPDAKNWLIRKDSDDVKDWRQEEKQTTEDETAGWHHWLDEHKWVSSGSWWWTAKPGMLQSTGSQRVGHDWAVKLNWTDTVKGFSIVNEAEVDDFLEFPCFLYDPMNVGNLISGSSAFSKPTLSIWKFSVHTLLKPSLKNFKHSPPNMWNVCDCMVI